MAYMTAVDSSSLSNQNIATPLLTHTYTNTTRVRKLFASIEADQVFGTGEYVVYATIQRGGAGAVFRAGSEAVIVSGGTTSLMFQALPVVLNVGDVLKTYIVGRGSDTTTPDITTRIWEEEAGSGGGGLDAAGVRSAIGMASANLDTQLADLPTNSELNARTLPSGDYFNAATDDVTLAAGELAGLSTLTAAQVWSYVTRELTSAGSGGATAQEVWEYATRTLTGKTGFELTAAYDAAKTAASASAVQAVDDLVDDLESRLTAARAGYLDKLNVSGTLAHSDDAATYKADVSSLATAAAVAALNNLSAAEAQTAASAALTAYDAATGTDVSGISVPTATQIADAVLKRGVVNIEDTADAGSLAELLLGAFESAVSGTTWTIRKTGGGTFSTRTVATDPNADPIVSVT